MLRAKLETEKKFPNAHCNTFCNTHTMQHLQRSLEIVIQQATQLPGATLCLKLAMSQGILAQIDFNLCVVVTAQTSSYSFLSIRST